MAGTTSGALALLLPACAGARSRAGTTELFFVGAEMAGWARAATATIDAKIATPDLRVLSEFFMPLVSTTVAPLNRQTKQTVEK
jgi:hypothetical protein